MVPWFSGPSLNSHYMPAVGQQHTLWPSVTDWILEATEDKTEAEVTVEFPVQESEILERWTWLQCTCIEPSQSQGVQFQVEEVNR